MCTDPLSEEKAGSLEAATINASEGWGHASDSTEGSTFALADKQSLSTYLTEQLDVLQGG